jgi:hypothetical protein
MNMESPFGQQEKAAPSISQTPAQKARGCGRKRGATFALMKMHRENAMNNMSAVERLHIGPVDLTLIYGKPGCLGREVVRQAEKVILQRNTSFTAVTIPGIGVDLLKAPGLTRARLQLSDGRLIVGAVRSVIDNYFELVEDGQAQ